MKTNFLKIFPTSSRMLGKTGILLLLIVVFGLSFVLSVNNISEAKVYNQIAQGPSPIDIPPPSDAPLDFQLDDSGRGDRGSRGTGGESPAEPIGGGGGKTSLFNPLPGVNSIPDFIVKVMDAIQPMILLMAVFFIILSGFQFLKAQGEPDKIKTAQTNIKWTLVGVAIVVGARALIALIIDILKEL